MYLKTWILWVHGIFVDFCFKRKANSKGKQFTTGSTAFSRKAGAGPELDDKKESVVRAWNVHDFHRVFFSQMAGNLKITQIEKDNNNLRNLLFYGFRPDVCFFGGHGAPLSLNIA